MKFYLSVIIVIIISSTSFAERTNKFGFIANFGNEQNANLGLIYNLNNKWAISPTISVNLMNRIDIDTLDKVYNYYSGGAGGSLALNYSFSKSEKPNLYTGVILGFSMYSSNQKTFMVKIPLGVEYMIYDKLAITAQFGLGVAMSLKNVESKSSNLYTKQFIYLDYGTLLPLVGLVFYL